MRQGGPAAAAREKGGWKSRGGNLGLSRSPSNRYPTMGEAMNEGVLGQIAARLRPRGPTPAEGAPVEYPIAVRQTQTTPDNTSTAYCKPPLLEVLGAQGHLRKQTESDKEKSVIEFFEVERTPRSPSPVLSLY